MLKTFFSPSPSFFKPSRLLFKWEDLEYPYLEDHVASPADSAVDVDIDPSIIEVCEEASRRLIFSDKFLFSEFVNPTDANEAEKKKVSDNRKELTDALKV